MAPESSDAVQEAAGHILAYLERHPRAADTAMGIAEWWVRKQSASISDAEVELALEQLVSSGFMEAKSTPGGDRLFMRRTC